MFTRRDRGSRIEEGGGRGEQPELGKMNVRERREEQWEKKREREREREKREKVDRGE